MRFLISPRPTNKYSVGIFLGNVVHELTRRGYQWTAETFHYFGFSGFSWHYAFMMGCPRYIKRIFDSGKPVILTIGKPESREECKAHNREYLPEYEQQELMMASAIRETNKVVFNSYYVKDIWKNIFQARRLQFPSDRKVTVIHHGVDTNLFSPSKRIKTTPFVIGSVGALRERFRLKTLFEVSRLLDFEHSLLLVGSMDIYCKDEFKKAMQDPLLSKRITYIPWIDVNHLPSYYGNMHCLFHPVDYESFGIVVAEAIACGVPVVVPAHGAPKEYILHNGGIVVDTDQFNYNEDFCQKMGKAVTQIRENWLEFVQGARESAVQNVSIEKCMDFYLDFMGLPRHIGINN